MMAPDQEPFWRGFASFVWGALFLQRVAVRSVVDWLRGRR